MSLLDLLVNNLDGIRLVSRLLLPLFVELCTFSYDLGHSLWFGLVWDYVVDHRVLPRFFLVLCDNLIVAIPRFGIVPGVYNSFFIFLRRFVRTLTTTFIAMFGYEFRLSWRIFFLCCVCLFESDRHPLQIFPRRFLVQLWLFKIHEILLYDVFS